jgi:hypothetical protein
MLLVQIQSIVIASQKCNAKGEKTWLVSIAVAVGMSGSPPPARLCKLLAYIYDRQRFPGRELSSIRLHGFIQEAGL